ncbi:hypothetical protein HDA37_002435 [Pseudonocardia antarctica]|uniref:Uncharacterized protein n=1 Tax=Pseudonocardia alni TaxID=33907 RepID=A0A852W1A7_PSEA5|nr:hypothetical protein [Pseudonocardia antarctica]OJG04348.1 hypothetical protein BG618_04231 [Pseudonocardia autotrophica]
MIAAGGLLQRSRAVVFPLSVTVLGQDAESLHG